jgi:hypothetical protein
MTKTRITAYLLALPRAERFKGVDCNDERHPVGQLCHDAAKVRVPCVAVDNVRIDAEGIEVHAPAGCAEDALQVLGAVERAVVQIEALCRQFAPVNVLLAETANLDRDVLSHLAAEVVHMNAGPAIDIRGILVAEQKYFHRRQLCVLGNLKTCAASCKPPFVIGHILTKP